MTRFTALILSSFTLTLAACAGSPNKDDDRLASSKYCLHDTGSRIEQKCSGMGNSYSREDLERTGSSSTADALNKLSPSINRGR